MWVGRREGDRVYGEGGADLTVCVILQFGATNFRSRSQGTMLVERKATK